MMQLIGLMPGLRDTNMNKHKGMDFKGVWYKRGERNKLIDAVSGNNKEEALDILFEIVNRGDL